MSKSIPASRIVSVNPAVLSAGSSPMSMNAVFLSKHRDIPVGVALSFANADAVGARFGLSSAEYKAAQVYFQGFDGSTKKASTLFFYAAIDAPRAAFLQGTSLKHLSLEQLKTITGDLTVVINGATKTVATLNLTAATSFSNAAQLIGTALGNVTVEFNEQLQGFRLVSSTTGTASTIGFATGTAADKLGLTSKVGAFVSQGAVAESASQVMTSVCKATLNWATFTTIYEPSLTDKLTLARWSSLQNDRYLYVGWGLESAAKLSGDTTCFGAKLKESQYSGVAAVYGDLYKAAFICGAIAAIDFTERQGRITLAFKGQAGLAVDITDATEAQALERNGYNYYGAWATANDRFLFMYPGQMSGKWKWIDSYVNQIRLNSQLQLALITLLTSAKSVPYNAIGIALQRAACQDAIDEALNFGSIQVGVDLSEQQAAIINNEAGVDAAAQIEAKGYYLMITAASAQTRGNRQSMPMKLWYADGGSVHAINMASINVQ